MQIGKTKNPIAKVYIIHHINIQVIKMKAGKNRGMTKTNTKLQR